MFKKQLQFTFSALCRRQFPSMESNNTHLLTREEKPWLVLSRKCWGSRLLPVWCLTGQQGLGNLHSPPALRGQSWDAVSLHLYGAAGKQGHPHTLHLLWFAQPVAKEIREKSWKYWERGDRKGWICDWMQCRGCVKGVCDSYVLGHSVHALLSTANSADCRPTDLALPVCH